MEFREIIVWLGLVAILVILWDGFRRMKSRPKKARKEPDNWVDPEEIAKKAEIARELPNGGARTREMTTEELDEIANKFKLNLRERVPMLMERVVVEGEESDVDQIEKDQEQSVDPTIVQSELDFTLAVSEPEEAEESDLDENTNAEFERFEQEPVIGELDSKNDNLRSSEVFLEHEEESTPEAKNISASIANVEVEETAQIEPALADASDDTSDSEPALDTTSSASDEPLPVEDLIVVHLMAKSDDGIDGRALLELLVRAGLRHGPMDIFHYRNPKGKTEFSLANCVQPGTFNPDTMGDVNTPGVTLFLQLPCTADAMESFEHMIEMARFMAANLNTDILDEGHSSVTPQVIEYYREKLRAFSRKQLIPS
jgi:cell division protein ZipA